MATRLRQLKADCGLQTGAGLVSRERDALVSTEQEGLVKNQTTTEGHLDIGRRIDRLRGRLSRSNEPRFSPGDNSDVDTRTLPGRLVADGVRLIQSSTRLRFPDRDTDFALANGFGKMRHPAFIDTETTGLSGGTGTRIFLMGIGLLVDGHLETYQFMLERPSAESSYWECIDKVLADADGVISYNGKSFDWPLMVTRRRLMGRNSHEDLPHLDLLHLVRRAFSSQWETCGLADAERKFLGRPRTDDLSGAFAPEAYARFLRSGCTRLLSGIIKHHLQDIDSLVRLVNGLDSVYLDPSGSGADAAKIGQWWMDNGFAATAETMWASSTHPQARRLLGNHLRQKGDWAAAQGVWAELAGTGDRLAIESLAKFHEHRRRDTREAMRWCEQLLRQDPDNPAYRHRQARLRKKSAMAVTDGKAAEASHRTCP